MFTTSHSAVMAESLHRVFANSPHAADSLELWLAVSAEADRQLRLRIHPALASWVPVFVHYRMARTEGEFFPFTGATRIVTGPLTGTAYTDPESAARAVVSAAPALVIGRADTETGDQTDTVESPRQVPSWRFRATGAPATPPAVLPLTS
ncbi:hypothetical protein ABZV91_09160 [Nocardia sp. NPDC004568]|uniref:hypothetical protein n=1 Tax=Nocardia sp. NPDC004568 TaxID=3154551 RepID=UPI0033BE4FE4